MNKWIGELHDRVGTLASTLCSMRYLMWKSWFLMISLPSL